MLTRSALFGLLTLTACIDNDPPALRTLVTVIATQEGQPVVDATRRLVAAGRPGLVVVEAALHTAEAPGRRRLVQVIAAVADEDGEGAALLGHLAKFDEDERVRKVSAATLRAWATQNVQKRRAAAAKQILAGLPSSSPSIGEATN